MRIARAKIEIYTLFSKAEFLKLSDNQLASSFARNVFSVAPVCQVILDLSLLFKTDPLMTDEAS